ncbi:MAG: sugar ABC transporter ATP-binding protein [Planctomycetaceae bacterium]|nr:sugar ABC transporter ATP-binding protein [Planctomycetaceae bacterium]
MVIVQMCGISKNFGISQALTDVSLDLREGECLGLVGHNGAGKSTLMNVLCGIFPPSAGTLTLGGKEQGGDYDVRSANDQGVWAIFQELSLCLNLTVAENMRVFHPEFRGFGWRKRAEAAILGTLDDIFPGHGIRGNAKVENLSLGQRQMLEIAKAFTTRSGTLRVLILDEPTSALDYHTAKQLVDYINTFKGGTVSLVYISHMLDEVLACTDRIVVMKDGKLAGDVVSANASREQLIDLMGSVGAKPATSGEPGRISVRRNADKELIRPRPGGQGRVTVRQGEIIGLAGLAGHGQTDLLVDLFDYKNNREYAIDGPLTFIPGDRQRDGNFPLWSIMNNISVQVYHRIRKYRIIDLKKERGISGRWKDSVAIRAFSMDDNILSLSGGNQQKVLFARSLESDARIVLMDDPTRGVDAGTKEIIYRLIVEECERGRSFVWYTTEMDELKYCDRVYVFKNGEIVAEMPGSEATEEAILRSSF